MSTDSVQLQEPNGTSGGIIYGTKVFEVPTVTVK